MLQTYDRDYEWVDAEQAQDRHSPKPWPFILIGSTFPDESRTFQPGDCVKHVIHGGSGLVVAATDEQMTVLWSIQPKHSRFSFPKGQRVYPGLLANQITSIQPMSAPVGGVFFIDYMYGAAKQEEDLKCTEGPPWSRLYHRGRRLLKCSLTRIRSLLSSFWSLSRSWPGRRGPVTGHDHFGATTLWESHLHHTKTIKRLIDEFNRKT